MPDQQKPHFEPPPWEQEAFERFRKEQDEVRAREELEAALRAVRSPEPDEVRSPEPEEPVELPAAVPPAETREQEALEAEQPTALSEARINAMLIELRGEEPLTPTVNKPLTYGAIAFMTGTGTYIMIQSALLFGDVRTDAGASSLLAGALSFVVLLVGLGFLGGAFLLFRKYREHL